MALICISLMTSEVGHLKYSLTIFFFFAALRIELKTWAHYLLTKPLALH